MPEDEIKITAEVADKVVADCSTGKVKTVKLSKQEKEAIKQRWLADMRRQQSQNANQPAPTHDTESGREVTPAPNQKPEDTIDTAAFTLALMDFLGKEKARAFLREYPDIALALKQGAWELFWEGLNDAKQDEFLSVKEHKAILKLAEEYEIPEEE